MESQLDPVIFSGDLEYISKTQRGGCRLDSKPAVLTSESLIWFVQGRPATLRLDDVFKVSSLKADSESKGSYFSIDACPLTHPAQRAWPWRLFSKKQRRTLERFNFSCSDSGIARQWVTALQLQLQVKENSQPPGVCTSGAHLVVLINPSSGHGQALAMFEQVRPLFEMRGVDLTLVILQPTQTIQGAIASLNLGEIDGLICVGGDGTLYQVLNGLMARPDWQTAIQLPLGVLPAGTSNGVCKTLLDAQNEPYDLVSAAFLIAKGQAHPIDIFKVTQGVHVSYGMLSVAWALISEVDIGADRWRFLGPFRNDVYALFQILKLSIFRGHLVSHQTSDGNPEVEKHTIEDDFIAVWAMNVAWASNQVKAAPKAKLCDGKMDLLAIRKGITRWQLVQIFLQTFTGTHIDDPQVEYYKTEHFELTPLQPLGIIAVDGERMASSATQVSVLKSLGRIISLNKQPSQT